MKGLLFLLHKELIQLKRNAVFLGILLFFTLMVLLIFPYAITYDIKDLHLSIVNNDSGGYSQRLISKMERNNNFKITDLRASFGDAMDDIESQKSLAIMVIPETFSKDITTGKNTDLQVMINSIDGIQASIAMSYIDELVSSFGEDLLSERLGRDISMLSPLEIKPMYKYNETLNYRFFMLPALIVVMITMYCGIFPAIMIVQEKEIGTLQQINVTPVHRSTFILSKIIPYWLITQVVLLLSILFIYIFHGLPLAGSYLLLAFSTFIFGVVMSFMGVIISNYSETLQQAMFIVIFFLLIFFLISGLFTPVNAMPSWAKVIAYANPLTYFNQIIRMIYLKGSNFLDILPKLLILCGFAFVIGIIAVLTHKKRES